jgi:MYXO-CTERM domain-containing protein
VISSDTWTNKITPLFVVPANTTYTMSLDGTALTGPDTETLGIIGPSFAVSVDQISMHPGDKDTLTAAPYATNVTYTASRAEPVTMELGVSNKQADYAFVVSGRSDQPGGTLTVGLPAESGTLNMANSGSDQAAKVNLDMTRYTKQGTQVFSHQGIPLAGGDTDQLQFGNWTNASQGIPLQTTHNGQQSAQILGDQAIAPGATPRAPLPSPASAPSATTPTTMPILPRTNPPPSPSTFAPPPRTQPIIVPPVNSTTTAPLSPSTTRLPTTTTSPGPTTTTVPRTTTTQRSTTTSSASTTVEMTTTTCKGGIGTGCCPEPPCGATSSTSTLSSSSASSAWVVAPMAPLVLGALLWRRRRDRRQHRAD